MLLLTNVLPLVRSPSLLGHWKMIALMMGCALIWYSQPPLSIREAEQTKADDRFSIYAILVAAALSIWSIEINWAYFIPNQDGRLWLNVLGLMGLVSGISLRLWAIQTLGLSFTATVQVIDNQKIITSGAYRYIRHPSYAGAYLALAGCGVLMQTWGGLAVGLISLGAAYVYRITSEERTLSTAFGQTYEHYCQQTARLIPVIW